MKRVVITGMGMVSPLGLNVTSSWNNLLAMKSGLVRVRDFKPEYPDVYMGLIPDFDPNPYQVEYCPSNLNAYTMSAVAQAIQDSNLPINESEQIGVNIGVMNSSMTKVTEIVSKATTKGFNKISPFTMLNVLSNMPTALVTIKYKLQGPSSTASTACATGASAIGDSYRRIKYGEVDMMIAGGSEDTFNLTAIYSSIRMQAMSIKFYPKPSQASRPFDEERSGFILAEGSGVLILEELEHALKRNARIYAEIVGYGESSDGFHLTRPQDFGEGGRLAMKKALLEAKLEDVDVINCHATSTKVGDLSEVRAIGNSKATLVGNKSQIGHTFGAAGAIESIFTILSVKEDIIPATLNQENTITNKSLKEPVNRKVNSALKNAFGFGGVNVSLVFKKYQQ